MDNTTIAAISTAYGEAGIGIVRMSGPDSLNILTRVFKKLSGADFVFEPRHMYYGLVKKPDGSVIDEALAVFMKSPHTYTGEDVAEIQCHGGNISVRNILSLLLDSGAVLADKGEFTKRAFLSGRIDLSQAEAVIDLIRAKADRSFDCAVSQLEGSISGRVKDIRKDLMELLVSLTVNMDYPDEDIEVITYSNIENSLSQISDKLLKLLNSSDTGRIIREGLNIAIVGKPNVGKSSLMNILLKENRSIVSSVPGTTRDTIEESASIRGIPVHFTDTAGIHDSDDLVESLGIERSKNAFNKADLLILVLDSSTKPEAEDISLLKLSEVKPNFIILNKIDLGSVIEEESVKNTNTVAVLKTSFKENSSCSELEDAFEAYVNSGRLTRTEDVLLTNVRHTDLVKKALSEITEALSMTRLREAIDFIEINVKSAFDYLGEITGETAGDQVINEVFSRFCLGK